LTGKRDAAHSSKRRSRRGGPNNGDDSKHSAMSRNERADEAGGPVEESILIEGEGRTSDNKGDRDFERENVRTILEETGEKHDEIDERVEIDPGRNKRAEESF
jgi:hypothetical protein